MGVLQPGYLWFLLIGALPLLIHLLMRLRVRRIRWGATYLLDRALARLREESRWWYYLLLASRVLVGLALGYAFARPFLPSRAGGGRLEAEDVHYVILVDNSYSMSYVDNGRRHLDQALLLVERLAERWPRGERFSLYTLADGLAPVAERQRFETLERLRGLLAGIRIQDGLVDLPVAGEQVRQALAGETLQLVLVADRQALSWPRLDDLPAAAAERPTLWLQPPVQAGVNLAVVGIDLPGQVLVAGDLVEVRVRVRCSRNASEPQPAVVELEVPGQGRQRRTDAVLPGQEREMIFDVRLEQPGIQAMTATLRTHDGLEWDDRMSAVVAVRERLEVGVFGNPEARAFDTLFDYLLRTQPQRLAESANPLRFQVGDWNALADYDAIVLDDPTGLPAARLEALEAFVRRGGGLLLSSGPRLQAGEAEFDHPLWPARLAATPAIRAVGGTAFWTPQTTSIPPGPLRALHTGDPDGLAGVRLYGYWPARPKEGAQVFCLLDNGEPWIVGRAHGFGRVVLLTSGLSGLWNNLPVRSGFLHAMHRLLAAVVEGAELPLNVGRGDDILAPAQGEVAPALSGPLNDSGEPTVAPLAAGSRHGRAVRLHTGRLPRNGLYAVRGVDSGSGGTERLVAVYDERAESDVAPLDEARLVWLAEHLDLQMVDDEAGLLAFLDRLAGRREMYVALIAALLLLLFGESLLSWKVGGGHRRS